MKIFAISLFTVGGREDIFIGISNRGNINN